MTSPSGTAPLYLLDTGILVLYVRAGHAGQVIESRYALRVQPNRPLVSVVSRGEILSLALQFAWGPDKRQYLEELIAELVVVDISSDEIVRAYAEGDHLARQRGVSMGKNDMWIAATAHTTGALLLTTDADFDVFHPDWLTRDHIDPPRD